jgi:hypothetical protein
VPQRALLILLLLGLQACRSCRCACGGWRRCVLRVGGRAGALSALRHHTRLVSARAPEASVQRPAHLQQRRCVAETAVVSHPRLRWLRRCCSVAVSAAAWGCHGRAGCGGGGGRAQLHCVMRGGRHRPRQECNCDAGLSVGMIAARRGGHAPLNWPTHNRAVSGVTVCPIGAQHRATFSLN